MTYRGAAFLEPRGDEAKQEQEQFLRDAIRSLHTYVAHSCETHSCVMTERLVVTVSICKIS